MLCDSFFSTLSVNRRLCPSSVQRLSKSETICIFSISRQLPSGAMNAPIRERARLLYICEGVIFQFDDFPDALLITVELFARNLLARFKVAPMAQ